jgi:hypothetical protein
LSLIQKWKPAGAVIVSTPQDLALIDATRAIDLFRKMDVPILGFVENMSGYVCPHCGELSDPFGSGGAEAAAKVMSIPFLGRVPLTLEIRRMSDAGTPPGRRRRRGGPAFPPHRRAPGRTTEPKAADGVLNGKETPMPLTSADDIAHLLSRVRFIALVGASDRPDRPSYRVMRFLQTHGYRVFPVNPQLAGQQIHGERVYGALGEIEEPIDMVDIFRRPQAAGEAWTKRSRSAPSPSGSSSASSTRKPPPAPKPPVSKS